MNNDKVYRVINKRDGFQYYTHANANGFYKTDAYIKKRFGGRDDVEIQVADNWHPID